MLLYQPSTKKFSDCNFFPRYISQLSHLILAILADKVYLGVLKIHIVKEFLLHSLHVTYLVFKSMKCLCRL